jgi:branched-chain amino acid transport system ATP-binding protein
LCPEMTEALHNEMPRENGALLSIEQVTKSFRGLHALFDVCFQVRSEQVKGLIGPNGSGKTTLFNVISGLLKATWGGILFRGEDISGLDPWDITRRGISRTFQLVRMFGHMTVLENVLVGCHKWRRTGIVGASLRLGKVQKEEKLCRERALECLAFVGMESRANQDATSLPLGEQRLVEIARALVAAPSLLLLDEPVGGLSVTEAEKLHETISLINRRGITVLLVEHDMHFVQGICSEVVVLNHGVKIAEGTFSEIKDNAQVVQAYLGGE